MSPSRTIQRPTWVRRWSLLMVRFLPYNTVFSISAKHAAKATIHAFFSTISTHCTTKDFERVASTKVFSASPESTTNSSPKSSLRCKEHFSDDAILWAP